MGLSILAVFAAAVIAVPGWAQCLGNLNGDFAVDGADLGQLLANWGPTHAGSALADLNSDTVVDGGDLGLLLADWGTCPIDGVPHWATLIEFEPSPEVVTDPELRAAIAASGLAWRVRDTGTGIEMLLVPPGTFQMGCVMGSDQYGCYSPELPVHQVTLTKAFYLGRFEVTQAQWLARMGSNPSYFQGQPDSPSRPIEAVSWMLVSYFLSATMTRLPTEAEWEFACRAGTQTPFHNGSIDDMTVSELAWFGGCPIDCSGNSANQTHPVGGRSPNPLGFYDMLGNVWEWVADWYGDYAEAHQVDPQGPEVGTHRVFRGGSYYEDTSWVRASVRLGAMVEPEVHFASLGFRVARDP